MKLTQKTIDAITLPKGKSEHFEWDDDLPGFGLRLRRGGARTWIYQYKIAKQNRRITLGNATALSPARAREAAVEIHAKVRLGQDPSAEKAESRARAGETMGTILENYLTFQRGHLKPRSMVELERHLVKDCRSLHGLSLDKIDRRAVATKLSTIANEKGGPTANHVRAALSGFLAWCIREGLVDHNVVVGTNIQAQKSRERVLSDAELKRIWDALGADDYSTIVRLLMLTGQRANEIGALRWSEIAGDIIQLSPARTKNNRGHTIPITAAVRTILDDRHRTGDIVFGRSQGFRGWAWGKERLDERIKATGGELEHWTHHDLRRTMATRMAEVLNVAPHVIEAVLSHSGHKTGIHGTYNRAVYEPQKRIALEKWADHLAAIVSGKQPAKVVQLRGA
jgi:integrase